MVVSVELKTYICFLTADGDPVYARLDSNPELESEPAHLAPEIQNEIHSVIS